MSALHLCPPVPGVLHFLLPGICVFVCCFYLLICVFFPVTTLQGITGFSSIVPLALGFAFIQLCEYLAITYRTYQCHCD